MSRIVWLPEALDDTRRLRLFLEDKSPTAAARAAKVLRDGSKFIASFPEIGRPMNDGTDRRELFIPFGAAAYVLRYVVDGSTIAIIRAWHSKEKRDQG